jgi:hypothetical protein
LNFLMTENFLSSWIRVQEHRETFLQRTSLTG